MYREGPEPIPEFLDPPAVGLLVRALRSLLASWASIAFLAITLMTVYWLTGEVGKLGKPQNLSLGLIQVTLKKPFSKYLVWDIAANVAMIVYFLYFYIKEFRANGALDVKSYSASKYLLPLYGAGMLILFFSTGASVAYSVQIFPHQSVLIQLWTLAAFALFITLGDMVVWKNHPRRRKKMEFELVFKFVDVPMFVGFALLPLIAHVGNFSQDKEFSTFVSGAVAFQVMAFNVIFSLLDEFPKSLSRGPSAILLRHDGEFSADYNDFSASWKRFWSYPK